MEEGHQESRDERVRFLLRLTEDGFIEKSDLSERIAEALTARSGEEYPPPVKGDLVEQFRAGYLRAMRQPYMDSESAQAPKGRLERFAHGSTDFAARLAGKQRPHLQDEWASMLYGEDGRSLSTWRRTYYAFGFLWSAIRMRARDMGRPFWRPVDWLLVKDDRTNAVISTSVGTLAIYIAASDSVHVLLTDGWEPCALLGGGLFVLSRYLRRVRGIELDASNSQLPDDS